MLLGCGSDVFIHVYETQKDTKVTRIVSCLKGGGETPGVLIKPGMGNEEMRNEKWEMRKWRNEEMGK